MLTLTKRIAVSLLAASIAMFAAFEITYRLALLTVPPGDDGQAGMGPFFFALWVAMAVGLFTSALLFRRTRTW